jgi:hypothetical protein
MGFLTAVPTPERQRLLDLLGVRAVLLDARPASRSPAVQAFLANLDLAARCRVQTAQGGAPVDIYANPSALPRAFLVGGLAVANGPEDALQQLLAADFDPRRTAIVEAGTGLRPVAPGDGPIGDARITVYESERVVVRTESTAPVWLVLTDSFDPDWSATRDGESVEILPADALFRGVPLPPGAWEVEFRYRPRAFRIGAVVSAVCLLSGFWILRRWRPRRTPQGATIASSSIS